MRMQPAGCKKHALRFTKELKTTDRLSWHVLYACLYLYQFTAGNLIFTVDIKLYFFCLFTICDPFACISFALSMQLYFILCGFCLSAIYSMLKLLALPNHCQYAVVQVLLLCSFSLCTVCLCIFCWFIRLHASTRINNFDSWIYKT